MKEPLEQIAADLVAKALRAGATAADVVAVEGEEFSSVVRLGKIESLKEAGSKSLGLRAFVGTRSASAYSSDVSALDRLAERTVQMARFTSEDPASGLPDAALLGRHAGDLAIYSEDIRGLSTEEKVSLARRAEEAARAFDPRIVNSEGSSFEAGHGLKVFANSLGFVESYRESFCSLSVVPVASQNGSMQRDYWYSAAHSLAQLEDPESVGRKAAERSVRRLGARKVPTARVPVVFDAETARSLAGHVFEAARGDAIFRNASFLAGKLGERVAGENITILDDGLRHGGFGSRPFDDEGVAASSRPVIENGVLRTYLLNSYAARKLKMQTTGNAARGVAGPPGIGPKNFYLAPGIHSPDEIIRSAKTGFYVTELIGVGVNTVNGDYSRGAAGLWIENGELAYPVEEVTLAGNLREMLRHVEMVGSDLEFRGAIAAPTVLVTGLTVAGA